MAAYEKEYAELGLAKDDVGSIELFYSSEFQNLQVWVKNKEGILIAEADTTLPSGGSGGGGDTMYIHNIEMGLPAIGIKYGAFSYVSSSPIPLNALAEITITGVYPILSDEGTVTAYYVNMPSGEFNNGPAIIVDTREIIPIDKVENEQFSDTVSNA